MSGFEFVHPASLGEAIALLGGDDPSVRPWSGGTALMLMVKSGLFQPSRFVCLDGIESRHSGIEETGDLGLLIGGLARLSVLEQSADVRRVAPMIAGAMKHLANVRVRNVARVGGALAHGDPHMDLPPLLAALGGAAVVAGPEGERSIPVEALYTGYYETVLGRGELITGAVLPSQRGWRSAYLKCTTRAADDWPALSVAVSLRIVDRVVAESRCVIAAATEKMTRLPAVEAVLRGASPDARVFERAGEAAAAEARTIDDPSGSADYKTSLLRVYVRRALVEAMNSEAVR